jgi:response regulator NasT
MSQAPAPLPDALSALRIVVINTVEPPRGEFDEACREQAEAAERARALRIGLLQAGYNIVAVFPADIHLPERVAQLQPDMIIIDAQSDARDVLEHVVSTTRNAPRPIVLFIENHDTAPMQAAIEAGVSAYVVAGLHSERIKPVLDVAFARFNAEQRLRTELSDTKLKLAERKSIERAKGFLMQKHLLSEEMAYQKMRRMAMDKNIKLSEVAQRILDVADLIG